MNNPKNPATEIVAQLKRRGRPLVEGSNRQSKLKNRAALLAAGKPILRGRPLMEGSKRQIQLAKRATKVIVQEVVG